MKKHVIIPTSEKHMCTMMNVNEIYSHNSFLDESIREDAYVNSMTFKRLLDTHLKQQNEERQKNSPCLCHKPTYEGTATTIRYSEGYLDVTKNLCKECGYVFKEDKRER